MPHTCSFKSPASAAGALVTVLLWLVLPGQRAHASELQLHAVLPSELAGCVTEAQLRSSYAHALAAYGGEGTPVRPLHLAVSDLGRSPDDPAEMQLELVASSAGRVLGQRTLPVQARDCAALPNALALVLVLMAQADPEPEPEPERAPDPPPARAEPAPKSTVSLSVGGLALFGMLPNTAFGLQLRAATAGAPWSARVAASALWPEELEIAEGSLHWQSYEVAVEGCVGGPLPSLPALAVRLCAGPRVGWMFARSQGFTLRNQRASVALVYLGIAPEAALRLAGHTWLQLGAGLAAALLRPEFVVGLDAGLRDRTLDEPSWLRAELAVSIAQIF